MAHILVVDDCEFICRAMADLFEENGWNVTTAGNGVDALKCAATEKPDLIILDLAMPRMDGLEAVRRLRKAKATRHVPIIMVTSWDDPESVAMAGKFGVDQYVVKPFDTKDLLARIRTLLDRNPPRPIRSMW